MRMRLFLGLILSFYSLFVFSSCPSPSVEINIQNSDSASQYFSKLFSGFNNNPAQYTTNFISNQTVCADSKSPCTTKIREQFSVCRLPSPVECNPDTHIRAFGKYGVNAACIEKCPQGYEKDQGGSCRDSNGCLEKEFLKNGQCSDRCSEFGSNANGWNNQLKDCNWTQQCGTMQKRQKFDLSSSTGLGSGACVDDPNGCPSGYAWLPGTNGGAPACRSTTSDDINSTCPSGTKIVGDGSTGQCQADGDQNSQSSSSTSTSTSTGGASSGAISSSSGIPGSTSSSGGATGGDNGGSSSSQGPGDGLTSSSSSGGTSGGTAGSSGSAGSSASSSGFSGGTGGLSSGSSSGGQTGGYSGRCDIPPQCQNSASIECAQLYQTWFAGCPLKGYTHQTYVEPIDDGKAKVRELFDRFKTRVSAAPVVEGFSNFVKFTRTGSCPTWPIDIGWFTATFDYLCSPIIPWGIISGVLIACSLLVAFRLAAK